MGEPTQGILESERERERERGGERSLDIGIGVGESTQAVLEVVNVDEPMQGEGEERGDGEGGGGGGHRASSSSSSLRPRSSTHSRGKTPDQKARGTVSRARGTDNRALGYQRGKTPDTGDTDRSRAKTPEGSGGIRRGIPPGFPPPAAWILATKSILLAKSRTKGGEKGAKEAREEQLEAKEGGELV